MFAHETVIRLAERKVVWYDSILDEDWKEFNRRWNSLTEYRLDRNQLGKHSQSIFTKRTNLGKGLGEEDLEFWKHLDRSREPEEEFPCIETGSVCRAFEGKDLAKVHPYTFWTTGDRRVFLAKAKHELVSVDKASEQANQKRCQFEGPDARVGLEKGGHC
jgi:hypothetical protein